MERLARTSAKNKAWWSDAAALRIEAASLSAAAYENVTALVLADRALAIDPAMPEAHFNRALALEKLGLRRAAVLAYRRSGVREDDARWTNETRLRIAALQRRPNTGTWREAWRTLQTAAANEDRAKVEAMVLSFPQQSRTWTEGESLAAWGDAQAAGNSVEARRLLKIARVIGETLRAVSGESLLLDAESAIERADGHTAATLSRAHVTYRRGRVAYSKRDNAGGAADLAAAARLFADAGSPMEKVARYFTLCALYDGGLSPTAYEDLRALRDQVPGNYRALVAQIDWEIGTILVNRGELNEALRSYSKSLEGFEGLREQEFAARLTTMVARTLFLVGQVDDARRMHAASIAAAARTGDDGFLENALHEAVADEMLDRNWEASQALLNVAIDDVTPANRRRRFDLLLWRSLLAKKVETNALQQAMAGIDDARLRADAQNDLRFAEAMVLRDKDPRRAADLLARCIEYAEGSGVTLMLPYLHLERARIARRLGETPAAIAGLKQAIAVFESRRQSIERRDFRDAYVGTIDDAFTELLSIYVERAQLDEAVSLAEHRRGRVFVDNLGAFPFAAHPVSVAEIAARLPRRDTMLLYTEAADRLLLTVIEDGSSSTRSVGLPLERVRAHGRALRDGIAAGDATALRREVDTLSDALLPIGNGDDGHRRMVIVTDESLRDIPFALLHRKGSEQPLVEGAAVVRAASGSAYVAAAGHIASRPQAIAAVADPAFDQTTYSTLGRLPGAAAEAREIATLYPRASVLTDDRATFANLTQSAASADVVHIGAHAIANRQDPALASLLLASDRRGNGACSLRRISALKLKRGATVVLAGCNTAIAGAGHGDLRDFANAFLAAGAANTVATLWDVDDQTTRQFATRLHRLLRNGVGPAEALRQTQLAMLHSDDSDLRTPKAWAAFQVYGSGE